jgi:hypothetical protein
VLEDELELRRQHASPRSTPNGPAGSPRKTPRRPPGCWPSAAGSAHRHETPAAAAARRQTDPPEFGRTPWRCSPSPVAGTVILSTSAGKHAGIDAGATHPAPDALQCKGSRRTDPFLAGRLLEVI